MTRPATQFEVESADGARRRRRLLLWGVICGFWGLFALLYASQLYLGMRAEGHEHSFWRMLAWQLLGWGFWGVLTPPILRLGRRFPFERATWARSLLVHLPACLLLAAAHTAFFTLATVLLRPFDPLTVERPFLNMFVGRLTSQLHIELLVYGAILGFGYAFDYYTRYREHEFHASQLEARLAQAQLQALKMQLHPHFLFNTLNGIAGLVRESRNREAVWMIAGLSDLLRYTLESAGKQEVPLSEELAFLELYLGIQQMRFSDRLRVNVDAAPETLDALVPSLILQPLVENAIRHGAARGGEAGEVSVSAATAGGFLELSVRDDGPGLEADWQLASSEGVGLANTRARLQQLYGARQRFDVRNRQGGGVEATLAIPFRLALNGVTGGGQG